MYLALIGGGHSSGKRTVTLNLAEKLGSEASSVCDLKIKVVDLKEYQQVPHKPSIDFKSLKADLRRLEGEGGYKAVLIHGNYALLDDELCDRAQLKIFLDTDADVRLSQWILRDSVHGKHRPLAEVLEEYLDYCRPEYQEYIDSTKHNADVLLPQGSDRLNIELLATGILEEISKNDHGFMANHRSRNTTSMINLRTEVANDLENQYYSTA